jgi:hypothetical protein
MIHHSFRRERRRPVWSIGKENSPFRILRPAAVMIVFTLVPERDCFVCLELWEY